MTRTTISGTTMSLKVYVYSNEELKKAGIEASSISCPSTVERVGNPAAADAFFVPVEVGDIERRAQGRINGVLPILSRLPHWKHERRHFFHMHSDEDRPIRTTAIVFRQSVNKNKKDPNTVAMPPPVEDFGYLASMDYEQLLYHVCFVGYDQDPHDLRKRCLKVLENCSRLNCYLNPISKHYGSYEGTDLGKIRRQMFVDGLKQSRLVLSPRGAGQHSYRLFEAMSAGRVPILLGDDYELPFTEFIDYNSCIFKVPESQAGVIDEVILQINERCRPTSCMADMAARARQYWVSYLARPRWDEMISGYLEKML